MLNKLHFSGASQNKTSISVTCTLSIVPVLAYIKTMLNYQVCEWECMSAWLVIIFSEKDCALKSN